MAQPWRTVRVFISSTLRDMHAERDHLVRFVFPELRERCAKWRLHLVDVDLRWGVTEEEAERGRVLEVCLDEIERCRPFFIGPLAGLVGRAWLVEAIEKWRKAADRTSRLFRIIGALDIGKSASAAQPAHYGRDKVIAVPFCEYDKPDHRNAHRIVRTLTFQIATRLPDYRTLLLTLPDFTGLDQKNPSEPFVYLLAEPLRPALDSGCERYLIVSDALDDVGGNGCNQLVEVPTRNVRRLPHWIGIVVSNRPEKDVTAPLQGLNPSVLNAATESKLPKERHHFAGAAERAAVASTQIPRTLTEVRTE